MGGGRVVTALLIIGLGLSACVPTATPQAQKGGTVVIRLNGDVTVLDPHKAVQNASHQVTHQLYDRLTVLDRATGKVAPYLAKSWTSRGQGSLTLALRTDAKCSDGTPVDATVVAASLTRFAKVSPNVGSFFGPGPYQVVADDATHVTVKVGTPFSANLLALGLSDPATAIICPAGLKDYADFNKMSYGSGPFTLVSLKPGDNITLAVRPTWHWGPFGASAADPGFPQSVVYRIVNNETTAANLLLTGSLDLANINGPDIKRLQAEKALTSAVAYSYIPIGMTLNEAPGHSTADLEVRKAVFTAIDRNEYNQVATAGLGKVATSIFMPNSPCYASETASLLPKPSIDEARAILIRDGYTLGSDRKLSKNGAPLRFEILGSDNTGGGTEYVGTRLDQVGFTVTGSKLEFGTYIANWRAGKFDGVLDSKQTDVPVLGQFIDFVVGPVSSPTNWAKVDNPEATAAVQRARTTSGTESCDATKVVQTSLLRHYDHLPLAALPTYWFGRGLKWVPTLQYLDVCLVRRV